MGAPLPYRWTGEAMEPLRGFARRADQVFVVGEVYRMEPIEDRSAKSHRQYFAAISEAWQSLPEDMSARFPSPEHLRKVALVMTGWRDEVSFVASSKAEAARLASFIRPLDEFSAGDVRECVVTRLTAKSQRERAMGRQDFQKSKQDVLDWIADLIGVSSSALEREGGQL